MILLFSFLDPFIYYRRGNIPAERSDVNILARNDGGSRVVRYALRNEKRPAHLAEQTGGLSVRYVAHARDNQRA